jgi:hypothetical protein
MADVAINDLPAATNVQAADLLVLWQQASNAARNISGQSFTNWLVAYADGHGGIQSIAKTSSTGTNPVVDTYTITLSDTTTSTFTVTNGLKGDTGDQTYVWVAYSTDEPTSDADISQIPDAWMGIYAGLESTFENLHYTDFAWYQIKGAQGDTGQGITSVVRTSGSGSPGTTDTYTMYAGEDEVGTFLVYNGQNGTGAVSTVNGVSPTLGNVQLVPADLGAPVIPIHLTATLTSLPTTLSNANITADMRVVECVFGTPSAIRSDVSWTTSAGNIVLSGTMSGSTTVDLILIETT